MRPINLEEYRTVDVTADRWGVSHQRVYVWLREGRITRTVEFAGRTLIHRGARKPRPKTTGERRPKTTG